LFSDSFSPDGTLLASGSWDETVKLWQASTGTEMSAQQLWDAIVKKDSVIEEEKTLIGKKDERIEELKMQLELDASEWETLIQKRWKTIGGKDTLIETQGVLIEELEGKCVHAVAPSSLSSLSSLSSTIQCCFHEHAKVRIRTLKMEERLKGVQKWLIVNQRYFTCDG
jgi:hypothetical protein